MAKRLERRKNHGFFLFSEKFSISLPNFIYYTSIQSIMVYTYKTVVISNNEINSQSQYYKRYYNLFYFVGTFLSPNFLGGMYSHKAASQTLFWDTVLKHIMSVLKTLQVSRAHFLWLEVLHSQCLFCLITYTNNLFLKNLSSS